MDRLAISSQDLKSFLTDNVKEEITQFLSRLTPTDDREKLLATYEGQKTLFSLQTRYFLALLKHREMQHISFVNHILAHFSPFKNHSRPVHSFDASKFVGHDHSKDELYFIVVGGSIYAECLQVATAVREIELERHYTLEPHHPEHESLTGNVCSDADIFEMAVDRISRNLQLGNGLYEEHILKKFSPKFTEGEVELKLGLYDYYVNSFKDLIQTEFTLFFPNVRHWHE